MKSIYIVVCDDVYNGQLTKIMGAYTSKNNAIKSLHNNQNQAKPTEENDFSGQDLKYFIQKVNLNK